MACNDISVGWRQSSVITRANKRSIWRNGMYVLLVYLIMAGDIAGFNMVMSLLCITWPYKHGYQHIAVIDRAIMDQPG
jgi:hypothetical protein